MVRYCGLSSVWEVEEKNDFIGSEGGEVTRETEKERERKKERERWGREREGGRDSVL